MAISTGVYQYTSDTGVVYQVALPSDFASALNMTVATGSEPYLPQLISPRYATYVSNSPLSYRQAVIATLQDLSFLPASLGVDGINYLLKSFVGESIPATTFPQLAVAAGPQGPPGKDGTPATLPVPIAQGGTSNDNTGSPKPAYHDRGTVVYDATDGCMEAPSATYLDKSTGVFQGNWWEQVGITAPQANNQGHGSAQALLFNLFDYNALNPTGGVIFPKLVMAVFVAENPGGNFNYTFPGQAFSTTPHIIFDSTGESWTLATSDMAVTTSSPFTGIVLLAGY